MRIIILFFTLLLFSPVVVAEYSCTEKKIIQCEEISIEAKNDTNVETIENKSNKTNKTDKLKGITERQDDRRPEDQFTVELFGRPLVIGGEYDGRLVHEEDFTLDSNERDDLTIFRQSIELEFLYMLSENTYAFFEGKILADDDLYREDDREKFVTSLERGEMWLYFSNLNNSNFDLQLGRQNFEDKREWWWDEDLDAMRLHYNQDKLHAEIGIAEEIERVSTLEDLPPEDDDIFRIIGQINWEWARKHHVGFYYLHHDDQSSTPNEDRVLDRKNQDDVDSNLNWWGFDTRGRLKTDDSGRVYYWTNLAFVRGHESVIDFDDFAPGLRIVDDVDRQDVRGWGVDLGATWQTEFQLPLRFTLSYATTSSDTDLNDKVDRTFRQTGLQDDNSKFRGVDSFRYYGELLQPELSNLSILTASAGLSILNNSSVELVYHNYRQVEKADFLRDVDIDADPNGRKKDIGDELDLIIGIEEWEHLELEIIGSIFEPGSAFDSNNDDTAYKLEFKLNYNF